MNEKRMEPNDCMITAILHSYQDKSEIHNCIVVAVDIEQPEITEHEEWQHLDMQKQEEMMILLMLFKHQWIKKNMKYKAKK